MLLELKDIKKSYSGSGKEVINLLAGVDLAVPEGKVTALVGGNGAGKTTLFNIISGYDRDFRGRVVLKGEDITRMPAYRIARKGVGRLFQGRQLLDGLTVMENLKIACPDTVGESPLDFIMKRGTVEISDFKRGQRAEDMLTHVFGDYGTFIRMLDSRSSELSYGAQRLVAMSRLLLGDYELFLLDEPTSGVNPRYIDVFCRIIRELAEKQGRTVLLIEHNMNFVRSVADECHYLAGGKIIKSGTPAEVLDDAVIRRDYMGL